MLKNILISGENYHPFTGGIEQFLKGLAQFLTEQEYQVWIYTKNYPEHNLLGEKKLAEGICIYSPLMTGALEEPFKVIKNYTQFAKFLKEKNIDLVFANNHNSLAWIKAAKAAKVPVIYGCHGVGLFCPMKIRFLKPGGEICQSGPSLRECNKCLAKSIKNPLIRELRRLLFNIPNPWKNNYWQYNKGIKLINAADGRYGNSQLTAKIFNNQKNTFGWPLPINSEEFKPEIDHQLLKKWGLEHKKYLLVPGRINYIKGQEYAVKALSKIKNKDLKLVLAGNGSLEIKDDSIKDKVILTGPLNSAELRKIYSSALVAIVPSIWLETFGYVTIESMACETPVIITKNCGSAECVDQETGFIIDRKSPEQITKIIDEKKPEEFIKMGIKAREKVFKNYDWKILGKKYIEMFENILKNHEKDISH